MRLYADNRWLEENDRSLVSVIDNLDMTTTIGQMVAGILAGAAQLDADAISLRVAGARLHLLGAGRVVGKVPFN